MNAVAQRRRPRSAGWLAVLIASGLWTASCREPVVPVAGGWRAVLDSPGGELRFGLQLTRDGEGWSAAVVNGDERRRVPRVEFAGTTLTLGFDAYGSEITAELAADGGRLEGRWRRKSGPDNFDELGFRAVAGGGAPAATPAASPAAAQVAGRWRVDFESESTPAIGIFSRADDGSLRGTFRTVTGDYRYLGGDYDPAARRLRLSVFDGAHAFLFLAQLDGEGALAGDFWSRASWHETWTAVRDDTCELPDPFELTHVVDGLDPAQVRFPDLDGVERSLNDESFRGAARIVEIFGTWCPNCDDATRLLMELSARYHARGLRILGLAFEMTGDPQRDAEQVRVYIDYHGIDYPVLLAGTADKNDASAALPWIDRVRAFPTFVFLDGSDDVAAVYTGFDGPATGAAHARLRDRFELLIEQILETYDPMAVEPLRWM